MQLDETVLILDFGSQYTQLIARRIREERVYCVIHPHSISADEVSELRPKGIVLSGSPSTVDHPDAPGLDPRILELGIPVLGICYGLQVLAIELGGKVDPSKVREYGPARLRVDVNEGILSTFREGEHLDVWMSHGQAVTELPDGFVSLGHTPASSLAAMGDHERRFYGLQFHPEVHHTPRGSEVLRGFLRNVCGCESSWTMSSFLETAIDQVKTQVGDEGRVICGLSGGVDSSVAAALIHKAIGERLTCIFVDNGLLREGELDQVQEVFRGQFHIPLVTVDAEDRFLSGLAGVTDPERKRKIIGHEFIEVFEEAAQSIEGARFLAQGTLYPDVIESVSVKGPSAVIKSHHNVGGLPEQMKLELVEPLRELFKDEVRELGRLLGLPEQVVGRWPFPGPGLAVRVIGEITRERLDILRAADAILQEEIQASGLYASVWQGFAALLPIRSVGVMGDERTYENPCIIRAVTSTDGMTADWARLPHDVLARISSRIMNEVRGINRVAYDISSKPPSTIEWE